MLLTKKLLKEYLESVRIAIPESLKAVLLQEYGYYEIDDEGHPYVYTEQDIYEQLRKRVRPYDKSM